MCCENLVEQIINKFIWMNHLTGEMIENINQKWRRNVRATIVVPLNYKYHEIFVCLYHSMYIAILLIYKYFYLQPIRFSAWRA